MAVTRSKSVEDQRCDTKTTEISEITPLSFLQTFIKPYDGNRDGLRTFLANCESAFELASESQSRIIFKYILIQLSGKAQTACSFKRFNKWEDLKTYLKTTFGEQKHHAHLLLDLQNCRQSYNDSVSQYALRLEACLTRLQTEIYNSLEDEFELQGRIAETEDLALNTFTLGLSPRISTILRCRNPRSLSEAISIAVEEEKILNLINYKPNSPSLNRQEAYPRDYSRRNNIPSQYVRNHNKVSHTPLMCAYCKSAGHHISDCRKRAYNNNRRTEQANLRGTAGGNGNNTPPHLN